MRSARRSQIAAARRQSRALLHSPRPLVAIDGELSLGTSRAVTLKDRDADTALEACGVPVVAAPVPTAEQDFDFEPETRLADRTLKPTTLGAMMPG